ncbi:MAG: DUF362 domain-containing protein [Thermodesulfobacteriota bacterium]
MYGIYGTNRERTDIPQETHCFKRQFTRREFLIATAGLAAAAVLPACSRTTIDAQTTPPPPPDIAFLNDLVLGTSCTWVAKGEHENSYALYKKAVEAATDFSWLSRGDRVLIKLSLNSGKPYPATTDPWSVHCMIKLLEEKGAGSIFVGDQSSFGTVQWTKDTQQGSSRKLARQAGLLQAIESSGAQPIFFEEYGWGAYQPTWPDGDHHWKSPIMIPSMLDDVDHIVFLPRVASHILAGNSLGFKLAVGFLRGDSRGELHNGGGRFYAMYEEINQIPAIASKLRLTVSSGRMVLTLFGPNDGPKAKPEYGLVIASENLLAHEMVAYAWLEWNRNFETSSFSHMTYGHLTKSRSRHNKQFTEKMWPEIAGRGTPPIDYFEPGNLYNHPAILNNLTRLGGRPTGIHIQEVNQQPDHSVTAYMNSQINI